MHFPYQKNDEGYAHQYGKRLGPLHVSEESVLQQEDVSRQRNEYYDEDGVDSPEWVNCI